MRTTRMSARALKEFKPLDDAAHRADVVGRTIYGTVPGGQIIRVRFDDQFYVSPDNGPVENESTVKEQRLEKSLAKALLGVLEGYALGRVPTQRDLREAIVAMVEAAERA